jgi:hypothetical protein
MPAANSIGAERVNLTIARIMARGPPVRHFGLAALRS